MADAFLNKEDTKLGQCKLTPDEENIIIKSLIINLQEFVMNFAGSDDAFENIIF
jgi:hypothetical protein